MSMWSATRSRSMPLTWPRPSARPRLAQHCAGNGAAAIALVFAALRCSQRPAGRRNRACCRSRRRRSAFTGSRSGSAAAAWARSTGQPQRRPVRADGGDQIRSPARRAHRRRGPGRRRAPRAGAARASGHRAHPRRRRTGSRPAPPGDGVRRGLRPSTRTWRATPSMCARSRCCARRLRRGVRCAPQSSSCTATPPANVLVDDSGRARLIDFASHACAASSIRRCRTASRAVKREPAALGRRSADGGRRRLRARRDAGRVARRAAARERHSVQPTGLLDAELGGGPAAPAPLRRPSATLSAEGARRRTGSAGWTSAPCRPCRRTMPPRRRCRSAIRWRVAAARCAGGAADRAQPHRHAVPAVRQRGTARGGTALRAGTLVRQLLCSATNVSLKPRLAPPPCAA